MSEAEAFPRQAINVGRGGKLAAITARVAIPHVVGEDEDDDELITEPTGAGRDDGALESDDEGDDATEEELGEDQDEDGQDEFDFDEDEDDFEDDEDDDDEEQGFSALKPAAQKPAASNAVIQPVDAKIRIQNTTVGSREAQGPEYIDIDVP